MNVYTIPVPKHLQTDVECIRIVNHMRNSGTFVHVGLNGLPGLVFQHYEGRSPLNSIVTRKGQVSHPHTLYLYGQMTHPGTMVYQDATFSTIQIVLKPFALNSLLGINAAVLTNQVVELAEFAPNHLNDQLLDVNDTYAQVQLLLGFLSNQLSINTSRDVLIEESLLFIQRCVHALTIGDLLDHVNLSERQFERRFRQAVGISPKFYMRIKRFKAAIELMKNGRYDRLTDIAYDLNFYDQSHFIRDIKAFSGITPRDLLQKVDDLPVDQHIISYR